MTQRTTVDIIGGGLAGTEAAWQLAQRGVHVRLHEMRPQKMTPIHHTGNLAELVCSNSLKSDDVDTAAGLLKHELDSMGSVVLNKARETRVPAGGALAVDRDAFSESLTALIENHPLIDVVREECSSIGSGPTIVCTGPLTSQAFEPVLSQLVGGKRLAFYDAAAPIVDAESIDRSTVFAASRYDKGGSSDYLNAPMDRDQYAAFYDELVAAKRVELRDFERGELFSACQPVEEVARTGRDSLRFGALKPVGLTDPNTGERPWAVVQLRSENRDCTAYNLVGFQTNLTFGEQERVFRMIPGLQNAEFSRHGVMHRNTFIDAPRLLEPTLRLKDNSNVWFAGQLTGTEGYSEAIASGLMVALNVYASLNGLEPFVLPATTAFGALVRWSTDPETVDYQPMHVNFGILPPLTPHPKGKRERYAQYSARARADLHSLIEQRLDLRFVPNREIPEQ